MPCANQAHWLLRLGSGVGFRLCCGVVVILSFRHVDRLQILSGPRLEFRLCPVYEQTIIRRRTKMKQVTGTSAIRGPKAFNT